VTPLLGHPPARRGGHSPTSPTRSGPERACPHCARSPPDRHRRRQGRRGAQAPQGPPPLGARADRVRVPGPASRAPGGARRRPSPLRAMQARAACRTAALGGHGDDCDACQESQDRDHAGTKRPGPTCQHDTAHPWLAPHRAFLLPVPHVLVPCPLPAGRWAVARRPPPSLSTLLVRRAAAAGHTRAGAPRVLGGTLGMLGGLHTWSRDGRSPPHVHSLVPGGGRSADGPPGLPARADGLVPVAARARMDRAPGRPAVHKPPRLARVPPALWAPDWGGQRAPVGTGRAALPYRARSLVRVALTARRLLPWDDAMVTGTSTDAGPRQTKDCPVTAAALLRRVLHPGLPARVGTLRAYGRCSPGNRPGLQHAPTRLGGGVGAPPPAAPRMADHKSDAAVRCPTGGSLRLRLQTGRPTGPWPP